MKTATEYLREYRERQAQRKPVGTCGLCHQPILEGEATQPIQDGVAHDLCYFEELGNLVERHPIVSPKSR